MSGEAVKLEKPQMRGLLNSAIKRNLIIVGCTVVFNFWYMKYVYGNNNKKRYADFYKHYDIEADFERMRKKGLFDSCDTD